jgi:hypothetical protein
MRHGVSGQTEPFGHDGLDTTPERVVPPAEHRQPTSGLGPSTVAPAPSVRARFPETPVCTMAALAAALTLAALLLSTRAWAAPRRTYSAWQVADVPGSLWLLLTVAVLMCSVPALVLLRTSLALELRGDALWRWSLVTLIAVGALVVDALVMAADAAVDSGPATPVFHWASIAVTALLAGGGVAASTDRARAGVIAATASGVVTLPLFALGWALYTSRGADPVVGAGFLTAALGVVPLVVAVALSARRDAVAEAHR